jgi:ATP-binding cassette subfamily B protein
LDEFIRELPGGLDTVLAEGGNISAGQKQRIAIGRAVIRNPRFLYLDEATSLLDPPTEREILAQLREVEAGRTRVIIAHNIASIRDADEILVLDDGLLVQRGTHETLLAEDGLYRRMWIAEEEKREREPASAGVT